MSADVVHGRARALAREFDASFAAPARVALDAGEPMLTIRVGGDRHAVRLGDLSGLVADRKIVPLPSRSPALLGVAGLRSGIVPVFSLGRLLGYGDRPGAPRWLLLVGAGPLYGLAFDELEGYRRVEPADIRAAGAAAAGTYIAASVQVDGRPLGLIGIPALTKAIGAEADRTKER